jgi:hypothetical protein
MRERGEDSTSGRREPQRYVDQHPRPRAQEPAETEESRRYVDQHPRPADRERVVAASPATLEAPPAAPRKRAREAEPEDEADGSSRIGNYHKGLKHNSVGEVLAPSYQSLLDALDHPTRANFEAIKLGPGGRQLVNPQAGFAIDLEGPNPSKLKMPDPPAVGSAEAAAEAVEVYWMALLRDIPFAQFGTDPTIAQAATELSGLTNFTGPKQGGNVTPQTIFRGFTAGDLKGPFVSQFLLTAIPYGSLTIDQRQQTAAPGIDYMTDFGEWLAIQDGSLSYPADQHDATPRYIRNMRDLGHYVHVDALYEAYLNACLILLGMRPPVAVDDGNPYKTSQTQMGFGTFGGPHILSLVCEVATRALKAVWYQKWVAHKRLRPEAYGGLVHLRKTGQRQYAIHNQVLNSQALQKVHQKYGSYLLPMAFPEGSPTHPAYGAGHATVAGACVTILKAWFDEDQQIPNPVEATPDGLGLIPYNGPSLTVGGELNKVAANVAIGRNMAGVHWRTDYTESVKLGEQVAICILLKQGKHDYKNQQEKDHFFTLTNFEGKKRTIKNGELFDENNRKVTDFKCPE